MNLTNVSPTPIHTVAYTVARSTTRVHEVPARARLLNGHNRRMLGDRGDSAWDVTRTVDSERTYHADDVSSRLHVGNRGELSRSFNLGLVCCLRLRCSIIYLIRDMLHNGVEYV